MDGIWINSIFNTHHLLLSLFQWIFHMLILLKGGRVKTFFATQQILVNLCLLTVNLFWRSPDQIEWSAWYSRLKGHLCSVDLRESTPLLQFCLVNMTAVIHPESILVVGLYSKRATRLNLCHCFIIHNDLQQKAKHCFPARFPPPASLCRRWASHRLFLWISECLGSFFFFPSSSQATQYLCLLGDILLEGHITCVCIHRSALWGVVSSSQCL